jgi:hypothetical protein
MYMLGKITEKCLSKDEFCFCMGRGYGGSLRGGGFLVGLRLRPYYGGAYAVSGRNSEDM